MAIYLRRLISFSLAWIAALPVVAVGQQTPREEALLEFFEKKIRPVLVDNCYNCHSANTNARGGLRVDDRNGLLQGGDQRAGGRPRAAREEPAAPGGPARRRQA